MIILRPYRGMGISTYSVLSSDLNEAHKQLVSSGLKRVYNVVGWNLYAVPLRVILWRSKLRVVSGLEDVDPHSMGGELHRVLTHLRTLHSLLQLAFPLSFARWDRDGDNESMEH